MLNLSHWQETLMNLFLEKWIAEFHQFLRNTTHTLANNVYHTKDDTYKKIKLLKNNKNIVIRSGDKYSSIDIMNKKYYDKKVEEMINKGVEQGNMKKPKITLWNN